MQISEFDERIVTEDEWLAHFGTPRHSGRYPWGSGQQPNQGGNRDFLGQVNDLRSKGMTDSEIAKVFGMKRIQLQAKVALIKTEERNAQMAKAIQLKEKGYSNPAIGREMGINESSVRALLNPNLAKRRNLTESTASYLQDRVDKEGFLDVGKGSENWRGISQTRLASAVALLQEKGYTLHKVQSQQQFGKGKTTILVLAPPGTTYTDVKLHQDQIKTLATFTPDSGKTWNVVKPPVSISSNRIKIRYGDEGGGQADGVIFVRPGVPDVSIGGARYAQVRIAVDDKAHYLKGMAMYRDDLPAGVDLVFNTSKRNTGNKLDAMKPPEGEGETPWTTLIRRNQTYTDAQGRTRQGVMNIVNEPGNWHDWRPSLSSQVLSKQSPVLAKRQLDLELTHRIDEFDGIMAMTNPTVKRKLLEQFADSADSAAVHLKAAALPHQGTHVILPLERIREGDIYAPNFRDGEKVALIRHPHGGTFEIPELTVNNRNPQGRRIIGTAKEGSIDVVGIHPSVASRLSGADFDGDAVLVIPNPHGVLKTTPALEKLKNFDPHVQYQEVPGMKIMTKRGTQQQMGEISNLITDMTIKGANPDEIANAVRHSMVVIDAQKHKLNYQQSYKDNGIAALKAKYQGVGPTGRLKGAATLISRAKAQERVPQRRPRPAKRGGPVDVVTGKKVWEPTGGGFTTKEGKRIEFTTKTKRLAEEDDARNLISKEHTPIEVVYAAHSNSLKQLANQARLQSLRTGAIKYSDSAAKVYRSQVSSLNAKLNLALKNAPLERQAQLAANHMVAARIWDNPLLKDDPDALKKVRSQALQTARARTGARKEVVWISDDEWRAVQAGAISPNKLNEILKNSDIDRVKQLATPRSRAAVSGSRLALAKARLASGYTQAEVAESLGVSVSTLISALRGEGK